MVRVQTKPSESTEEKKETTEKKKTPSKKKAVVTGVWPCKINGCNKQFAREADLKRHQRTTKLHSMPGFACPQCDATFTRTDALRRHQKSRHNGVIIEPTDSERNREGVDETPSSGSKSRSHSETPSSKGKDKLPSNSTAPTALAQPGTAGPVSGPSSYYRQHTVTNHVFTPPHPAQGVIADTQYPQGVALPTSATRLHQANWPSPPPWTTDGPPPQMGPIYHQLPGQLPIYYQPSPYYRPNAGLIPQSQTPQQTQINPELVSQPQNAQRQSSPHATPPHNSASRTGTPIQSNHLLSQVDPNSNQQVDFGSHSPNDQGDINQPYNGAPVIDPSLDTTTNTSVGTVEDAEGKYVNGDADNINAHSLKITQAAMEAVLESVRHETDVAEVSPGTPDRTDVTDPAEHQMEYLSTDSIPQPRERHLSEGGGDADAEAEADEERALASSLLNGHDSKHGYHTPLRPEPMEHMLTEDGEPMLNPAELLTQESLASPPPS